jgi:Raf kinase inhibitor-like YbhB/YbcL family protein
MLGATEHAMANAKTTVALVRLTRPAAAGLLLAATFGCAKDGVGHSDTAQNGPKNSDPILSGVAPKSSLTLTSSAFASGSTIPKKYTCQGDDVSVPLAWAGVPKATQSLLLVVDDPDAPDPAAPQTDWVHWIVYNLAPTVQGLDEATSTLPGNAASGLNDWKRIGYRGPCPPTGRHRYFFRLYALDLLLDLVSPTLADVRKAVQGHVIGNTELIGTYQSS